MKPRILRTQKLLAVALTTAAAGCAERPPAPVAETAASVPHVTVAQAVVPEAAAASVQEVAPAAAVRATPTAPAEVSPAPPRARQNPSGEDDPALLALRDKLLDMKPEQALAQRARFRPLCDADGYPLVGNLARKKPTYNPSELCKDLREKAAR